MRYVMTMSVVLVASAFGSASLADAPDAGAKMRGEVNGESRGATRSRPVYRRPIAADSETGVAQDRTEQRSYSYDANGEGSARSRSDGHDSARTQKPAKKNSRNVRRYSYDPQPDSYDRVMPRSRSRSPSYLLPKTDPRRYR